MTDEEMKRQAKFTAEAMKAAGAGTGPSNGSWFENLAKGGVKVSSVFDGISEVVGGTTGFFNKLRSGIEPQVDIWRGLSNAGISFQGGIVEMAIAARGARVDSESFAETLRATNINLRSLGGTSQQGTRAFADLTKQFYDVPEVADSLRTLGYTNKELNDVMALSVTLGSATNINTDKARDKEIAAARQLAEQLELTARLTGMARKDQEEKLKEAQRDAAFQAKIEMEARQIADPAKREEYRRQAQMAYVEAQAAGMGDFYKDMYVYGTTYTEKANNSLVLMGEGAQTMGQSIQKFQAGDLEGAKKDRQLAQGQIAAQFSDMNTLQIATMGAFNSTAKDGGDIFLANATQRKAMDAFIDGERAKGVKFTADEEYQARVKYWASLTEKEKQAIEDQKKARGDSASTDAILKLKQRELDIENAVATGIVKQANRDLAPELIKVKDGFGLLSSQMLTASGQKITRSTVLETAASSGYKGEKNPYGENVDITGAVSAGLHGAGVTTKEMMDLLTKTREERKALEEAERKKALETKQPEVKRLNGSPGIKDFLSGSGFDKMFENFGAGTNAILHGEEVVATKDQMSQMLAKAQGSMGGMLGGAGLGGSALNDMLAVLKQISTTMSQLVMHTSTVAGNTSTQIRVTKNLSNNMYEA
jgi:hypothetical protein